MKAEARDLRSGRHTMPRLQGLKISGGDAMGLDFAIDALYQTDFKAGDVADCKVHRDGRVYPSVQAVGACFETAGYSLTIRHVQLFDCYRAEWRDGNGDAQGAVVGQTSEEAAVYALSLLRRQVERIH